MPVPSALQKLTIRKFSLLAIPNGSVSGLQQGCSILTDPERFRTLMQEARTWVDDALRLVKSAPDNPYASDEEIAQAILNQLENRTTGLPK